MKADPNQKNTTLSLLILYCRQLYHKSTFTRQKNSSSTRKVGRWRASTGVQACWRARNRRVRKSREDRKSSV